MSIIVFLTTFLHASYSNCPKVSMSVSHDYHMRRNCSGTLLRVSTRINSIPGLPDAGGKKDFSTKTSTIPENSVSNIKTKVQSVL